MSKNKSVKYTNEPIGEVKIIPDFLPTPSELVLKEEKVKVTLSLTKECLEFYKKEAEAHHTHYHVLMRSLLAQYATIYQKKS